jgi:hypothetical protein
MKTNVLKNVETKGTEEYLFEFAMDYRCQVNLHKALIINPLHFVK